MERSDLRLIIPATLKTTVLGPEAVIAARKLPVPVSFKLVTSITLPPLPPRVLAPNPSAPGKDFSPLDVGGSVGMDVGCGVTVGVEVGVEVAVGVVGVGVKIVGMGVVGVVP